MIAILFSRLRFFIWFSIGRSRYSNWLFLIYERLFQKNLGVVDSKTSLVIEGFPRSGNTFLFSLINDFQKGTLIIAHHLHTLSQIKNAVDLNRPAVIMVRNPIDAIISFRIRNAHISFLALANYYLLYHEFLLRMSNAENLLIVDFNLCISSPNAVIKLINDKLGFQLRPLSENELRVDVINKIKKYDQLDNKSEHSNSLTVSVPTQEKRERKAKLLGEMEKSLTSGKREELLKVYNRLTV